MITCIILYWVIAILAVYLWQVTVGDDDIGIGFAVGIFWPVAVVVLMIFAPYIIATAITKNRED